ncbi:hypothetical protein [Microvirga antarctica]|uniref:hypothetical protein n=1 Tax=Microvirga antarctica TaxID=2819233 RepID=UPI001B313EDA|nr:hypothetical protein [Microvirga antarctica]
MSVRIPVLSLAAVLIGLSASTASAFFGYRDERPPPNGLNGVSLNGFSVSGLSTAVSLGTTVALRDGTIVTLK